MDLLSLQDLHDGRNNRSAPLRDELRAQARVSRMGRWAWPAGVGFGLSRRWLTSAYLPGNRVVGVDIDRVALARASQRGIETVWADLDEPLPFEDSTFDVVVIAEVLEHLRFPENVLAEAKRVLVPGGAIVGSVPNCYRLKSRLRFLLGRPPERETRSCCACPDQPM
jgi:SAM-dependent methyltransferase